MNTKTRQEQYREQVLCKLINETNVIHNENINWYNIELPFSKVRVYYNEEHKPTHVVNWDIIHSADRVPD